MAGTAFNDRVGNLSLNKILPKVVDTVNRSNVINLRVLNNPKAWNGKVINQNIFTTSSSQGEFFHGAKVFSSDIDMSTTQMSWYPTGFGQPIAYSRVDQALSNTESGVIAVTQASADYAANSMKSRLGDAFYATGPGDQFDGLRLIVDDSTETSSYGGLSRTTYGTYINGAVNAASGGVLDMDFLATLDDDATVSGVNEMSPNIGLTTKAVWSLYESLLEPTKKAEYRSYGYPMVTGETSIGQAWRGDQALGASGGFQSLDFRGKPFVKDEKCPANRLFLLNEYNMEFHSLKIPGLKTVAVGSSVTNGVYDKYKASAFQFRDYMEPYNQPTADVGYFIVYGNLIHRDPRLNAQGTGITTV